MECNEHADNIVSAPK